MEMNILSKSHMVASPEEIGVSRILVVDDDIAITEEAAEILSDEGFACERAFDGHLALKMVLDNPDIGVVITDLKMPGMDGLELIRKINETIPADRDLAVIVVTGHAGTAEAVETLRLGAMDFLTKPIDPDHLVHATRRADETVKLRRLERLFNKRLKEDVAKRTAEAHALTVSLEQTNTMLEQRNRELAISNKVKTDFLALISHELRTPLNAVIGFSEIMALGSETGGNDTEKEYNREVAAAGRKLLRIVNTILELIDVDCGDMKLRKASIDINDMVGRVVEVLKPKADDKPITLKVEAHQTLPAIDADANRVIQALGNVVENAIHFSPPGSDISIGAKATGDTVTITVTDRGKGMTEEEIKIAGEAFRQVDASAAKEVYGLGLGLPLARMFIELHGGALEIESNPCAGTTVRMSLQATANGQDKGK
ncbi:MAG: hybrid sensor histidine kinase/response regulator [Chromatiales bacterium]|jgi:signal transduction histidine kinase|nr:hybrid sensor histidine kinase/response regulator [Chromatiales bacterium]